MSALSGASLCCPAWPSRGWGRSGARARQRSAAAAGTSPSPAHAGGGGSPSPATPSPPRDARPPAGSHVPADRRPGNVRAPSGRAADPGMARAHAAGGDPRAITTACGGGAAAWPSGVCAPHTPDGIASSRGAVRATPPWCSNGSHPFHNAPHPPKTLRTFIQKVLVSLESSLGGPDAPQRPGLPYPQPTAPRPRAGWAQRGPGSGMAGCSLPWMSLSWMSMSWMSMSWMSMSWMSLF